MRDKILTIVLGTVFIATFIATAVCIFLATIYLLAWFLRLWWGY